MSDVMAAHRGRNRYLDFHLNVGRCELPFLDRIFLENRVQNWSHNWGGSGRRVRVGKRDQNSAHSTLPAVA
jgi:hypothetical protein